MNQLVRPLLCLKMSPTGNSTNETGSPEDPLSKINWNELKKLSKHNSYVNLEVLIYIKHSHFTSHGYSFPLFHFFLCYTQELHLPGYVTMQHF